MEEPDRIKTSLQSGGLSYYPNTLPTQAHLGIFGKVAAPVVMGIFWCKASRTMGKRQKRKGTWDGPT